MTTNTYSVRTSRDYNEEVGRCDHLSMVADERQPPLLWIGGANRSTGAQVFS